MNTLSDARTKVVQQLQGLVGNDYDLEVTETMADMLSTVLDAAHERPIRREYRGKVWAVITKEWDDYVDIDQDALEHAVIPKVGESLSSPQFTYGDIEVREVDTEVNITATVETTVAIHVYAYSEAVLGDHEQHIKEASLDAVDKIVGDDWEVDPDSVEVEDVTVTYL